MVDRVGLMRLLRKLDGSGLCYGIRWERGFCIPTDSTHAFFEPRMTGCYSKKKKAKYITKFVAVDQCT